MLILDYLPITFEASGAKCSIVINCTRLRETDIPTDGQTDRPTDMCNAICPLFLKGGGGGAEHKKREVNLGELDYLFDQFVEGNYLAKMIHWSPP